MRAIVLCAGYGTRLGELTRHTPKPLLSVSGRPALEYILRHLKNQGFNEVVINLHFLPELIQSYFGDGKSWGLNLIYSYEPKLLGTAGGVKNVASFFCSEKAFLVQYGDVITDQGFPEVVSFHLGHRAIVTVLLHRRSISNSVVAMDSERRITLFSERPDTNKMTSCEDRWVNSGVYICSPEVFDYIPQDSFCDFPRDVFPKLIRTGRLFGYPVSGYRCAIDSAKRLAEVGKAIEERRCLIQVK